MEVVTAEFMPHGKQLYILVADSDKNLQVFQYDPESPKSASGRRLVHRSTFHTGHFPVCMNLLPNTAVAGAASRENSPDEMEVDEEQDSRAPQKQVLVATQTGVLALVTPVDELIYLRLNALQTYMTSQVEHACGLNPRGYRAAESERLGIKGIIDGTMLKRWCELSKQRRAEACSRMGIGESIVRADLALISGGGLDYL
jgi:cleavage and polyadenylation specificity factor subunit 1